jgi:histidinol-phosphate phosphatase family protein
MLSSGMVNKRWTLFLDRDGVLNERPMNDYVRGPADFLWKQGALKGLAGLSGMFGTIVVVTNQQGIGKGLMTADDLELIHKKMLQDAKEAGGRIDKVYFCGERAETRSFYRKPSVGMGLLARKDFPHICFSQSVMVGDTISDMRFGKRLKMRTVLICKEPSMARNYPGLVDLRFADLEEFFGFLQ